MTITPGSMHHENGRMWDNPLVHLGRPRDYTPAVQVGRRYNETYASHGYGNYLLTVVSIRKPYEGKCQNWEHSVSLMMFCVKW